ncbi:MAG TPA: hypothetical protein PKB10_03425 [Tepidisphaeraceae bacterium]|nr:hypothetical protein [Tepidisphaeraceae bacterium]
MAKGSKKRQAEAPTSDCILLCEDVLESKGRGKHMLQGVINIITVQNLPAVIGPLVAYVRMRNVYSRQRLHFSLGLLEKEQDGEILSFDLDSPDNSDPLGQHTLIIAVPPFPVEQEGRYVFTASHNGEAFAQTIFALRSYKREE